MPTNFTVYAEDNKSSGPRPHEKRAAEFLANYFQSDVVFLKAKQSKNPDIYVLKTNVRWELKSPTGGGKRTIQNNLREASGQSENIVLDFDRIKLTDAQGVSRVRNFIKTEHHSIRRLKILTKDGRVIDILDR